ncbi:MAG: hypothetical protein MK077_01460 [Phycisphaerales bacterium]|nr:hypothetical protein [Phycisphaerales bacterium]
MLATPPMAWGWDSADTQVLQLDQVNVLRIVYSPSTGGADVQQIRGACPPETVTHTDSDFGPGQYVVQAGFAEGEAAAASWTLPLDHFPLRFELAEMLFATSGATQSTTTEWGVEIWQGSPQTGSLVAAFQSDDVIIPHLTMPPGTSGTIVQFMVDPDDPDQIYVSDNGEHSYSVAFRVIAHHQPGSPCITSPPSTANAFPTTDVGGLAAPGGNWIDMVTGPFCVCGADWTSFQQLPGICTPSGDWVLRSTYTPFGCAPASGACCVGDGSCDVTTETACAVEGGDYQGDGTSCDGINCPQPQGACCIASNGNCVDSEIEVCAAFGGEWFFGETCATYICFPEGACCLPDGSCVEASNPESCADAAGVFQGDGTECSAIECPAPTGACCTDNGDDCFVLEEADCVLFGGSWLGAGTNCDDPSICNPSPCPADVDGDDVVGVDDLLEILGTWGQTGSLPGDVNGDGIINVDDVLIVIGAWGPC